MIAVNGLLSNLRKVINSESIHEIAFDLPTIKLVYYQDVAPLFVEMFSKESAIKRMIFKDVAICVSRRQMFSQLFSDMISYGLRFLPLKGITLCDVYPIPETRNMHDVDIYVNHVDLLKIRSFLEAQGFRYLSDELHTVHHEIYEHDQLGTLEVHHTLIDGRLLNNPIHDFNKSVWMRTRCGSVCGVPCDLLGHVDMLVHILMHIVSHITVGGIGIKQALDFTLYVKKYNDEIDWEEFWNLCGRYDLEGLALAISDISINHLGVEIPLCGRTSNHEATEALLEDMMLSGNLGSLTLGQETGSMFLKSSSQSGNESIFRSLMKTKTYFWPMICTKYPKASKIKLLSPILFVMFLFRRLFLRGSDFKTTLLFAFKSYRASKRRYRLAKLLNIR